MRGLKTYNQEEMQGEVDVGGISKCYLLCILTLIGCASAPPTVEKAASHTGVPTEVRDDLASDMSSLQALVSEISRMPKSTSVNIKPVKEFNWSAAKAGIIPGAKIYKLPNDISDVIMKNEDYKHYNISNMKDDWVQVLLKNGVKDNDVGGGWVKSSDIKFTPVSFGIESYIKNKTKDLIDEAILMRDKWTSNPYVQIKGFSLNLSVTPALQIDFEFPKTNGSQ